MKVVLLVVLSAFFAAALAAQAPERAGFVSRLRRPAPVGVTRRGELRVPLNEAAVLAAAIRGGRPILSLRRHLAVGATIGLGVGVVAALVDPLCRGGSDPSGGGGCPGLVLGTGIAGAIAGAAVGGVVYVFRRL